MDSSFAQNPNQFQKQWQKADSLLNQNLPKSAIHEASEILKLAQAGKDAPNVIKAQLFIRNASESFTDDFYEKAIDETKENIQQTKEISRAIWQSVLATYYLEYYEANRYKILQRTSVEMDHNPDFRTWDIAHLSKVISDLYLASMMPEKALQAAPANDYAPLLTNGKHSAYLKLTMYDVLANVALDFFQNQEMTLTRVENQFGFSDDKGFAAPEDFIKEVFSSLDSDDFNLQAIKIYQQLTSVYINAKNRQEALVDLSLRRLMFVYSQSTVPNKDEYFFKALCSLSSIDTAAPTATADVWFQLASFLYQPEHYPLNFRYRSLHPEYKDNDVNQSQHTKRNLPFVKQLLEMVIQKFPKTKGAADAQNLLNEISKPLLDLTTEAVYLPREPIKALLNYKNANKVYLRIYQVSSDFSFDSDNDATITLGKLLASRKPIDQWGIGLRASDDLEQHATEFKVDALPFGNYFLVASSDSRFSDDSSSYVVYTNFQVSNLSLILETTYGETPQAYVLNRKTGQAVSDVVAAFWKYQYSKSQKSYQWNQAGRFTSDEQGVLGFGKDKIFFEGNRMKTMLTKGKDTLIVDDFYSNASRQQKENGHEIRTFLFKDRSIYRPGQTIYFKGKSVYNKKGTAQNKVVGNKATTVTFRDVNGQKVSSQVLTTNDYGSFSGSFVAPETGLTGSMAISNEYGSVDISVEEYKRPKFYVQFDTLKSASSLFQKVTVKGFAKAYAGNNIDAAKVSYSVVRNARFPYFWAFYRWGQPTSREQIIAHGITKTNPDGSFEISFTAYPDQSINSETLPVFSFEVTADVTDQNGETHTGTQEIQLGYQSLEIDANVPEQGLVPAFDSIAVTTRNLNGAFVPTTLEMTIQKLQFPGKTFRKRIWPQPDQPILSEEEFRKFFPDDEYGNESDYHYWKPEPESYSEQIVTTKNGKIKIPKSVWKQEGWYVLSWKGKDAGGKELLQKEYAYVVIPGKSQRSEKPLVVIADKQAYLPGEDAKMWLGLGFDKVHLYCKASVEGDFEKVGWLHHEVREQDRGGFGFSWFYLYNNREYHFTKAVSVPWTNKELAIEWGTHRDKLLPGAEETWTVTIKGSQKEKVAAELLAGMYDASLDAFQVHRWYWDTMLPGYYSNTQWKAYTIGDIVDNSDYHFPLQLPDLSYVRNIPMLNFFVGRSGRNYYLPGRGVYAKKQVQRMMVSGTNLGETAIMSDATPGIQTTVKFTPPVINPDSESGNLQNQGESKNSDESELQVRKNLQETAFFLPQLRTDENGNITFSFTMPEALTKWKFRAFAHTKDWKTGYLEGEVRTQKDLMVQPNLPRFLRQGDNLEINTKVVNLSYHALKGKATLEILNALTNQPLDLPFRLQNKEQDFSVVQGRSTVVAWQIHVPESVYQPVIVRIVARSGSFSDGEENSLPVLTNRVLVTEALPLPVKGAGIHHFQFEDLLNSQKGGAANRLVNHQLTVEFTGNPVWYAVQALPYLMEYPFECSEQTFSRFYANALAEHIIQLSPTIKQIFDHWLHEDTTALLSNLAKNQELKTALLNETPWVMEAQSETEQKHRIAVLFESYKVSRGLNKNLKQLAEQQLPDGSFPWFRGMRANRYITQYILAGFGRLQQLSVSGANSRPADEIIKNALQYLDKEIAIDYSDLLKNKVEQDKQQITPLQIQYLYLRSFYLRQYPIPKQSQKAFDYYKKQSMAYRANFNPYLKALLALALHRMDEESVAEQIIAGLKETAVHQEGLGMYWKSMARGYDWYQSPIEAQSMLIAAFKQIGSQPNDVADMKTWLLKNKQTTRWNTTTATADAVYALLLDGADWLTSRPEISIQLGNQVIRPEVNEEEAGSGYFKRSFSREAIHPEMGNIQVSVLNPENKKAAPVSWGAVYWQYFQDMDKVDTSGNALHLKKELFVEQNTKAGTRLVPLGDSNQLKVGDKVKVRMILKVDRDMEYVHLKDRRAATFEPVDVLSGYRYQNGLGYYQSTLDAASNFFFDHLPKGTYVLEYEVFVAQKGEFSNGISTLQCMYAPEFSSHSNGQRVKVE